MTTERPKIPLSTRMRAFAFASVFVTGLCGSSCVWGVDNFSVDTLPVESLAPEPETAPTKLHDLTTRASELAMRAMSMLGIRYKYGGTTPELGMDCSGLVRYLFKETWGAELPRTTEEISRLGRHVDAKDLQTGDLVFYKTLQHAFSHVGIYLGDNKFIHSPATGGEVRIESMDLGYWRKRFNGARRINDPAL